MFLCFFVLFFFLWFCCLLVLVWLLCFSFLAVEFDLHHEPGSLNKEITTPYGMDTVQQVWQWADVGSRQMPREPLTYPALMVTNSQGDTNAAFSHADRIKLFQWVNDHLGWISRYNTIYVFVDNRSLASPDAPDYWPLLAPWIQSRCAVVGPYLERTTAIHFPISAATGLQGVHYTWAGPVVLEALCLAFPTINFVLTDTDCVPTSLFEVAELVNLLVDKTTRAITMQHHTMASSTNSPPAVLLATEAKAELNAGLVIVTGHKPTQSEDASMDPPSDVEMRPKEQEAAMEEEARAHKSRRIANPRKSPEEWVEELSSHEMIVVIVKAPHYHNCLILNTVRNHEHITQKEKVTTSIIWR